MVDDTAAVCDHYLHEFRTLEERFGQDGAGGHTASNDLGRELVELSEQQARQLSALASASSGREVAAVLHEHPLHQEVILQSSILKHALDKPRGYAGDMELMLKICHTQTVPAGGFAEHLDSFYGNLPASQAVRDRVCMLARLIDDLPDGSRVLNLACGPVGGPVVHGRERNAQDLRDVIDGLKPWKHLTFLDIHSNQPQPPVLAADTRVVFRVFMIVPNRLVRVATHANHQPVRYTLSPPIVRV